MLCVVFEAFDLKGGCLLGAGDDGELCVTDFVVELELLAFGEATEIDLLTEILLDVLLSDLEGFLSEIGCAFRVIHLRRELFSRVGCVVEIATFEVALDLVERFCRWHCLGKREEAIAGFRKLLLLEGISAFFLIDGITLCRQNCGYQNDTQNDSYKHLPLQNDTKKRCII